MSHGRPRRFLEIVRRQRVVGRPRERVEVTPRFAGDPAKEPAVRRPTREATFDEEPRMPTGGGKKKYYN